MESVFGNGRTPPLRRPPPRGRSDDRRLPRVRHLPQDRLQDPRPLQGRGQRRTHRSMPSAGPLRQPAAAADRGPHRQPQARQAALGCAQDPRAARPPPPSLLGRSPGDLRVPAQSTIHAVLDRHGLVAASAADATAPRHALVSRGQPNDLWCADFKGEFRLGNSQYCYPLTVTDHASRFLLLCEALDSVREEPAIAAFQRFFASAACPAPSAPTTASPSPAQTPSSISPSCRSGGSASASPSSASSQAIRSRTAATSACT